MVYFQLLLVAKQKEYYDLTNGFGSEDTTSFDAFCIGASYGFETISIFKPSITYQTSLYTLDRYNDDKKAIR